MAQFAQDSSTGSSDSSSSSASSTESELDFDAVRPKAVKFNEAGAEAPNSNTEKEEGGDPKAKKKTGKRNKKTKQGNTEKNQGNTEKNQEVKKEKLTPERTVHLVKKIIANNKKRAAKDKKKFNNLLRSASASARKYKAISTKAAKRTT